MKNKKNLLLAIAIFGGVLFTVEATNIIDLDGQTTSEIRKGKRKISSAG